MFPGTQRLEYEANLAHESARVVVRTAKQFLSCKPIIHIEPLGPRRRSSSSSAIYRKQRRWENVRTGSCSQSRALGNLERARRREPSRRPPSAAHLWAGRDLTLCCEERRAKPSARIEAALADLGTERGPSQRCMPEGTRQCGTRIQHAFARARSAAERERGPGGHISPRSHLPAGARAAAAPYAVAAASSNTAGTAPRTRSSASGFSVSTWSANVGTSYASSKNSTRHRRARSRASGFPTCSPNLSNPSLSHST